MDLPGLGRRDTGLGRAGIYLSGSALALAVADREGDDVVMRCRADPLPADGQIDGLLAEQIATLGARHLAGELVLAPDHYALTLIERPKVEADELHDAVRWQIQENISYPAEQAAIDVFDLPDSAARGRPSVFVAAVHRETLGDMVARIFDAGVEIDCVDITELALRNIVATMYPDAGQAIGLLRLTVNGGMMNVTRGHELFLSRRLSGVPETWDDSSWQEFQERMLLQVQRSIDYYESVLSQPRVDAVVVGATDGWQERIVEYLAEMLPMPVRGLTAEVGRTCNLSIFNPEPETIDWDAPTDLQVRALNAALPAVGGALRSTVAADLGQDAA